MKAAPRSVNRLRRIRSDTSSLGPRVKPANPTFPRASAPERTRTQSRTLSTAPERPAVDRLSSSPGSPTADRVRRPIGRPPKTPPGSVATPPGQPEKHPYTAPSSKILGRALTGTFNTLAIVLGPHWRFKTTEGVELAEDWIPVLEHYKIDLGKGGLWAVAIGGTLEKLGPRIMQSVIQKKTGLKPPQATPAEMPGPAAPGAL